MKSPRNLDSMFADLTPAAWMQRILAATSHAAAHFMRDDDEPATVQAALALLGDATGVSRVYVFAMDRDAQGRRLCSQRFEWCAAGVEPQIDNPDLQNVDLDGFGFGRWLDVFEVGRSISGLVAEFPISEQPMLEAQGILALAAMPVRAHGRVWGFIGFDDCNAPHDWTQEVLSCLGVAANVLGAALERSTYRERSQRLEKDLKDLVDHLADIVFQLGVDGCFSFLSPAWERLTGFTVAETLGRPALSLIDEEDRAMAEQKLSAVLSDDGYESRSEVRIKARNGESRWVLCSVRRMAGAGGLAGTMTDIQSSKETRQALVDARFAAEAGSRAKSEFLGAVSHELRTPLNAILGLTEAMMDDDPLDPVQAKAYLGMVHASGKKLLEQINGVLDLARLEAGSREAVMAEVDMRHLLDALLVGFRNEHPSRTLELVLPLEEVRVVVDGRMIRQATGNLLKNALKFTPPEGRIGVTLHPVNQGVFAIDVSDTGIGIAEEHRALLFETFRQVDGTLARGYGGTGLGLAIADRLVRQHHGGILVQSELGRGSTFTLRIPASAAFNEREAQP